MTTRPRRVALVGAMNLRDLGGYPTAGGGQTRWGRVYRSDSLHGCTDHDLAALDDLGVRVIYDLRRDEERHDAPPVRTCVHVPLPSRRVADTDPATLRERIDGEQWLLEYYQGMLDEAGPGFGRLYSHLAERGGAPAVFHCWGGKDRTGMAAALLLSWLQVDRETILDDYELTDQYAGADQVPAVVDSFVASGIARPAAEGMLSAPRWAMAGALETLDDRYGGIESYLRGPAGMTARVLRSLRQQLTSTS